MQNIRLVLTELRYNLLMNLTPEEQQRILDLASGALLPDNGMEKHFVMVLGGKGRACTREEKEWLTFWRNQSDSVASTDPVPHHLPNIKTPEATPPAQPVQAEQHIARSATSRFLDEFDTPADLAFEDEVIFEEVREKLDMLLANPGPHKSFVQQLVLINKWGQIKYPEQIFDLTPFMLGIMFWRCIGHRRYNLSFR